MESLHQSLPITTQIMVHVGGLYIKPVQNGGI